MAATAEEREASVEPRPAARHDALVAFQNAFKLGGSLLFTWVIAFAIRILLPRHLGPAAFGYMNFADAFTVTTFVLLYLGVDTYIRKEVPVRPELASDIFGGVLLVRLVVAVGVFVFLGAVMRLTHRPPIVAILVYLFGLGQVCMSVNTSLAAILQARGSVDGLSVVNVAGKLLWGAGILVGIAVGHVLVAVAASFFVGELVKCAVLFVLARKHVGLKLRCDLAATKAALVASLPFYLNGIAFTAYGRIDVTVLSFVISDEKELGWYGAASNLASLCMLVTPLIGWVLLPLFAKAAARDREELRQTLARSMEIVLTVAIPTSLMVALGADLWIRIIFGVAFAPAGLSLRLLATMFILTYVAMVSATCLNVIGRGWFVTAVSTAGLVMNPFLNVALVRLARSHLGVPGAAGAGAALSMLLAEAFIAISMTAVLGGMAFDRRSVSAVGRMVLAAGAVVALDWVARPLGWARLALDIGCYVALVFMVRAIRWGEMVEFARAAFRRRAGEPAA